MTVVGAGSPTPLALPLWSTIARMILGKLLRGVRQVGRKVVVVVSNRYCKGGRVRVCLGGHAVQDVGIPLRNILARFSSRSMGSTCYRLVGAIHENSTFSNQYHGFIRVSKPYIETPTPTNWADRYMIQNGRGDSRLNGSWKIVQQN